MRATGLDAVSLCKKVSRKLYSKYNLKMYWGGYLVLRQLLVRLLTFETAIPML